MIELTFFKDAVPNDKNNKMAKTLRNIENLNVCGDQDYDNIKKPLNLENSKIPKHFK